VVTCPTCQTENAAGTAFCRKCGAYLRWGDHPPVAADASAAISLQLAADAVSVTPGTEGGVDVWVRNAASTPAQVALELYESAAAWASVEPSTLQLPPGGQARARVRLLPPADATATARGPSRLGVRATPNGDAAAAVAGEAIVAVAGVVDFSMRVEPERSKAYRAAGFEVAVANTGNAPVTVDLTASEPSNDLDLELDATRIDLAPGGTASAALTARVRRPRRVGRAVERPCSVEARSERGPTRDATAIVTVTPGIPLVLAAVAVLALVLGAVGIGVATMNGDEDASPYHCPELVLPPANHRPADFDGGANSVAVYVDNGVHVAAMLDEKHGASVALPVANNAATPIGSAHVDDDEYAEALVVAAVTGRETIAILKFLPPCQLSLVNGPTLTNDDSGYGIRCSDSAGGDLVVTTPAGTKALRLLGDHLETMPGPVDPVVPGFRCGSLFRQPG